jgi:hypothetical protein
MSFPAPPPFEPGSQPAPPPPDPVPLGDAGVPDEGEPIGIGEADPRWKIDYHGLLFTGALRGYFRYLGHRIDIRTLRSSDELILGLLTREYSDTVAYARAHAQGIAALAVEAVDGKPMPVPLGENGDSYAWARDRYAYAGRWYPFVIDAVFERYLELEQRARAVLDELGKGPARTGPLQTPGSPSPSGTPDGGESSPVPA